VILAGVGSDIGQDGHLVDVGVVFGVYIFEFRVKSRISGSWQAGIALVHLGVRISFMKIHIVVFAWLVSQSFGVLPQ
jgi:hypothetical protein